MQCQRRELLNILLLDPLHLGSVTGFSFIKVFNDELFCMLCLVADPEAHSNPRTIGLNLGCHAVSLKKIDIGQFMYMKYNTKGSIGMPNNNTVSKASLSIFTLSASRDRPMIKTLAIDNINIQTAYIGYLSFKGCPSELTKIESLFKTTFCFLEIIYGVTKRLANNIWGVSNALASTKPATNMSQNMRFQKLSFERNLLAMFFSVFLIVNNSILLYQQGLSKGVLTFNYLIDDVYFTYCIYTISIIISLNANYYVGYYE